VSEDTQDQPTNELKHIDDVTLIGCIQQSEERIKDLLVEAAAREFIIARTIISCGDSGNPHKSELIYIPGDKVVPMVKTKIYRDILQKEHKHDEESEA